MKTLRERVDAQLKANLPEQHFNGDYARVSVDALIAVLDEERLKVLKSIPIGTPTDTAGGGLLPPPIALYKGSRGERAIEELRGAMDRPVLVTEPHESLEFACIDVSALSEALRLDIDAVIAARRALYAIQDSHKRWHTTPRTSELLRLQHELLSLIETANAMSIRLGSDIREGVQRDLADANADK
jgi:hypothetical protein